MPKDTSLVAVQRWLADPCPDRFPLAPVLAEFRAVGKHFVAASLLAALAAAREVIPESAQALHRFLDTTLDKHDGRFDNLSYLALHDLPLPATAGRCPLDTVAAARQQDRLITLLVADVLRFEIAACEGHTQLLPLLRPDRRTTAKRCALGLRVLRTAMARLGLDVACDVSDPIEAARQLCARTGETAEDRRMLAVTLLTVSTVHDEHLFVRMLQGFETVFARIALELRAAILAVRGGDAAHAVRALTAAADALDDAAPLFSLVATMQPEAFMTFRAYTDGASAIQSRSYKTIESLCRRPDERRLAGPGYDAVPDVRARVHAGQPTLQDALAQSALSPCDRAQIRAAMTALEREVLAWRKTHHNIATRMLGLRRGTGRTEGVPYLAKTKDIPLFKCPFAPGHSAHAPRPSPLHSTTAAASRGA